MTTPHFNNGPNTDTVIQTQGATITNENRAGNGQTTDPTLEDEGQWTTVRRNRAKMNPPHKSVCFKYKKGVCPHGLRGNKLINGMKCKYAHPIRCKYFCRSGPTGCRKGENCNFFHPILCKFSVKEKICVNEKCTYIHLKGTTRKPENRSNVRPTTQNQTRTYEAMNKDLVSMSDFLYFKQMVENHLGNRFKTTMNLDNHRLQPSPQGAMHQNPAQQYPRGYPVNTNQMRPSTVSQHQQGIQPYAVPNSMPLFCY